MFPAKKTKNYDYEKLHEYCLFILIQVKLIDEEWFIFVLCISYINQHIPPLQLFKNVWKIKKKDASKYIYINIEHFTRPNHAKHTVKAYRCPIKIFTKIKIRNAT